ncbi:MAG: DUF1015 domain-containing protein [Alphaproteobacteria bacterium]
MRLLRPFAALRPAPGRAAEVAAPPYDVVTRAEAAIRAAGRPWSFLHVSRAEIDLPAETDTHSPEVYAGAAAALARMREDGVLRQDAAPAYYVYRLTSPFGSQTGVVAVASVAAYESGDIRKHEHTRPDKEDDRVRHMEALDAQTGPVMISHRPDPTVAAAIAEVTAAAPEVDITADDGVGHALWPVADAAGIARLDAAFAGIDRLYIADGHHRSAAAARVAAARRDPDPALAADQASNWFLAVVFAADEMHILDYNRVVRDLAGLDAATFLARVAERFEVIDADGPVRPSKAGEFGLYFDGAWRRLVIRPDRIDAGDPVKRLDVSLLGDHLIEPVLGISDPRNDPRIDFVGGARGLEALEARVDSGEMAVAFSLYPTPMAGLMEVADAGAVMPPKSTWFEPKLADGLVIHLLG